MAVFWSIALAALAVAGLIAGWVSLRRRARSRRLRAEAQERLRRLQEEAVEEERRRRQARMTHDLKAPIHALLGMADLLAEGELSAAQREQVATLRTSAELLLALVRDILDLERLESGALRLRQEDFSLRRLVEETVALQSLEAAARGIALKVEIAEEVPEALRGDPVRIRQVLLNLLGNAVKFTPARARGETGEAAEILVRIGRQADGPNGRWRCSVTDQGVGMTPATVERLFEPFSQADTTLVRAAGGSGLGLAICRQLVAAMGGQIGCESERGEGSMFWFHLPLVPAEGAPPAASRAPAERFAGRVLVVDDEAVNRLIARAHLEALGVEVAEAGGGEAALERLAAGAFDLVLTDLKMPGVDGLALARRRRAREQEKGLPSVPIIAVTAQGEETLDEERAVGMDDRLPKPFRRADLAALLRRWLPGSGEEEGTPRLQPWQEARAALQALGETTGEDEVAKAVASFRESSARHLEDLEAAWRAGDRDAQRDPLHGLSGSAEFLGGMGVVRTSAEIRQRLDEGGEPERSLLDALRREVDRTAGDFAAG